MRLETQEALEEDLRGKLVDGARALGDADAAGFEDPLSLDGGQALIPIAQGNAGVLGQAFCEFASVVRLRAFAAAQVQRVAHENEAHATLFDQFGERREVLADVRALKRGKPLSGDAEGVAERQSDAAFAEIEGENAWFVRIGLEIHVCPNYSDRQVLASGTSSERSIRVGVGILAAAAAVALLYYGRVFFITILIAAIIAFLLEPLVEIFLKLRFPRGLASFVACSISLMFIYFVALGLYTEGVAMAQDLPAYSERINEVVDGAAARVEHFQENVYRTLIPRRFQEGTEAAPTPPVPEPAAKRNSKKKPDEPPPIQEVRVRQEPTPLLNYLYDYFRSFYNVLLMASFVPFLVYFILSWRDHLRGRLLAMVEGNARYTVAKAMDGVAEMVRAYVIGNFLLGLLLSLASALLFAAVKLPYWIVVAPMSGFLSLAPYIGMPLALVPPLVAALPLRTDAALYLYLTASVAVLHLLALNLLYPKFVGSRVHLNPLAVTIALMFWGMLWGGIGLLLAIPLTAAIKAIFDNVGSLQHYGRLLGD